MIPPLQPGLRIAETSGTIARNFHRWLQLIERGANGPKTGLFAPGSFVVATNEYAIHAEELVLGDNDEAVLGEDSILVVV